MLAYDPHSDAYFVLGAHPKATPEEIEEAYRKAARTWHPDKSKAPDAAERFREVQEAAAILRNPGIRRDYDRLRVLHYGVEPRPKRPTAPPPPYQPLGPAPAWFPGEVRVVRDSVIFVVRPEAPSRLGELAILLAVLSTIAAFVTNNLVYFLVALVGYAMARVNAQPPERRRLAWAKLVPGRRLAEYSALDRRAGILVRYDVPFAQLHVKVTPTRNHFRLELNGFPGGPLTLHHRIRDPKEARKRGKDVSIWLGLPLVA